MTRAKHSGQATLAPKVVHREGFRFRGDDKLVDPSGWSASTHRTAPPRAANAAVNRPNLPVSVGVVLHLSDVQPEAALTLELNEQAKEVVALKDILGGRNKLLKDETVSVRLVSTATPVATEKTEDDFPAAAYGPDGALWLAYISYTLMMIPNGPIAPICKNSRTISARTTSLSSVISVKATERQWASRSVTGGGRSAAGRRRR